MTRQPAKSIDFRKNYLYDFHLRALDPGSGFVSLKPCCWQVTKPHLKKVEVSVTPGLPICLDLLLQLSFANVRDIKKSVTIIVGRRA